VSVPPKIAGPLSAEVKYRVGRRTVSDIIETGTDSYRLARTRARTDTIETFLRMVRRRRLPIDHPDPLRPVHFLDAVAEAV
jgi:hypothetical protein